jgi:hypothetical protein
MVRVLDLVLIRASLLPHIHPSLILSMPLLPPFPYAEALGPVVAAVPFLWAPFLRRFKVSPTSSVYSAPPLFEEQLHQQKELEEAARDLGPENGVSIRKARRGPRKEEVSKSSRHGKG